MLGILPAEIILSIFSFLPLRQLHRLLRISKPWKSFIETNDSDIYHAAAVLHGFVPPKIKLHEATLLHTWLDEVDSWKRLCTWLPTMKLTQPLMLVGRRYYRMERRWEGCEQPGFGFIEASGKPVWRFKVDQEQSAVITTHFDGGLGVFATEEDQVLWSISRVSSSVYSCYKLRDLTSLRAV